MQVSTRNIAVTFFLLAAVGLASWFFARPTPPLQTNNQQASASQLPSVTLDQLCNCGEILSDGATISAHNPDTNTTTVTIQGVGVGEGSTDQPRFVATSPSGREAIIDDQVQHRIQLLDTTTGKISRTIQAQPGQYVSAWAWSPDESTVLLGLVQQDLTNVTTGFRLLTWSANKYINIPLPDARPNQQLTNLLGVDNNGASLLVGWFDGQTLTLYSRVHDLWQAVSVPAMSSNLQYANAKLWLSGISNGNALLAYNDVIFQIHVGEKSPTALTQPSWSTFPLSPPSADGNSILVLQWATSTAHGEAARYIPTLNVPHEPVTQFDLGDGFRQSVWLPGNRFLATYNSYDQSWYVLDVMVGAQHPLQRLLIPQLERVNQIIGFWETSPTTRQKLELYDLGGKELTLAEQQTLLSELTRWTNYQPEQSVHFLPDKCGHPETDQQTLELDASDKSSFLLNGAFQIVTTPNIFHWDAAELKSYNAKSICGVGGTIPQVITDNKILWWQDCAGGSGYNSNSNQTNIRCIQAEDVVQRYFRFN